MLNVFFFACSHLQQRPVPVQQRRVHPVPLALRRPARLQRRQRRTVRVHPEPNLPSRAIPMCPHSKVPAVGLGVRRGPRLRHLQRAGGRHVRRGPRPVPQGGEVPVERGAVRGRPALRPLEQVLRRPRRLPRQRGRVGLLSQLHRRLRPLAVYLRVQAHQGRTHVLLPRREAARREQVRGRGRVRAGQRLRPALHQHRGVFRVLVRLGVREERHQVRRPQR
jgi:hypothetical protein